MNIETINKSKVDIETSDIFFNFGALKANTLHSLTEIELNRYNYLLILKRDAKYFLEIVDRPNLTPQDLVDDFLERS